MYIFEGDSMEHVQDLFDFLEPFHIAPANNLDLQQDLSNEEDNANDDLQTLYSVIRHRKKDSENVVNFVRVRKVLEKYLILYNNESREEAKRIANEQNKNVICLRTKSLYWSNGLVAQIITIRPRTRYFHEHFEWMSEIQCPSLREAITDVVNHKRNERKLKEKNNTFQKNVDTFLSSNDFTRSRYVTIISGKLICYGKSFFDLFCSKSAIEKLIKYDWAMSDNLEKIWDYNSEIFINAVRKKYLTKNLNEIESIIVIYAF